jgi:hypothetical protein
MSTPSTWKCPGCGVSVAMPAGCVAGDGRPDERRLDQLAQALCGCWVVNLPDSGVARLLNAIMVGDEAFGDRKLNVLRGSR